MILLDEMNSAHWAVPQWPEAGDDSEDALYRSVGRFLSRWEKIETTFADLYTMMVSKGDQDTNVAARAFGTIATFRGRAEMLEAATEAYCDEEGLPDFRTFMAQCLKVYRGIASRRNEIAHGSVIPYEYLNYALGDEIVGPVRYGFVLVPPEYSTNKRMLTGRPKYVYNSEAIETFAALFDGLQIEANSSVVGITKRHNRAYQGE